VEGICLLMLGELDQLEEHARTRVREAVESADLRAQVHATLVAAFLHLRADDPDGGRARVREIMMRWRSNRFGLEELLSLFIEVHIDLYAGRVHAAGARIEAAWPTMRRSLTLQVQFMRVMMLQLRGAAALAVARRERDPRACLARAQRIARRLAREGTEAATGAALLLRAGIAVTANRGDPVMFLSKAACEFGRSSMAIHEAATRGAMGGIIEGERGHAMVRASEAALDRHGIRNPGRWTAMLVTGVDRR
jgi:hypothetical protein